MDLTFCRPHLVVIPMFVAKIHFVKTSSYWSMTVVESSPRSEYNSCDTLFLELVRDCESEFVQLLKYLHSGVWTFCIKLKYKSNIIYII